MQSIKKSSKVAALEIFNQMDLKLPNLADQLYTQHVLAYENYFGVRSDRSEGSWFEYCLRRDLFLQFLGKINLSAEIKNQETFASIQNYASRESRRYM